MFVTRKIVSGLMMTALFLALASYAHAQQNQNVDQSPSFAPSHGQPSVPGGQPPAFPPTNTNPEWQGKLEERTERREFREEAETLRAEHEDLESERDRLKLQCLDAKGQERTSCHDRSEVLRAKNEALHQRIMSLHEKMQAERNRDMPPGDNEPGAWRSQHAQTPQGGVNGGSGIAVPTHASSQPQAQPEAN